MNEVLLIAHKNVHTGRGHDHSAAHRQTRNIDNNTEIYDITKQIHVTEHEETRLKTQFAIVYNAHIKVKYVFYFLLKSNLLSPKQIVKIMQFFVFLNFLGCCFHISVL